MRVLGNNADGTWLMEPFPRCIQAVLKAVRHSVAAARLFSLALRLRFRPLIHLQARSSKHWRCQQLIRRTETDSGLQSRVQIKLVGGLSWLYGIIVFCETLRFLTSLRKWIDCKIYILIMAQPFFTFLRYSSLSFFLSSLPYNYHYYAHNTNYSNSTKLSK